MPDNSHPARLIAQTRAANSARLMPTQSVTPPTVAPGYSTAGTKPHTGGVAELDLQKEILAQQIQKASLANQLAEAGGTGRYAKRATPVTRQGVTMTGSGDSVWDQSSGPAAGRKKSRPKYVAGSGNFETDETTDNPDQIRTDFEAFHPGLHLGDFAGATRDTSGNYISRVRLIKPSSTKKAIPLPRSKRRSPKPKGDIVMMRMDAARKRAGLPSNNGAVPAGFGTQDNPVPLTGDPTKSSLQLRSLATGTWVIDR